MNNYSNNVMRNNRNDDDDNSQQQQQQQQQQHQHQHQQHQEQQHQQPQHQQRQEETQQQQQSTTTLLTTTTMSQQQKQIQQTKQQKQLNNIESVRRIVQPSRIYNDRIMHNIHYFTTTTTLQSKRNRKIMHNNINNSNQSQLFFIPYRSLLMMIMIIMIMNRMSSDNYVSSWIMIPYSNNNHYHYRHRHTRGFIMRPIIDQFFEPLPHYHNYYHYDRRRINLYQSNVDDDEDEEDDNMNSMIADIPGSENNDGSADISNDIDLMTVIQLQQQLRLRGLKISGKKNQLIQRLNQFYGKTQSQSQQDQTSSKQIGVDVNDYIDIENQGKDLLTKTIYKPSSSTVDDDDDEVSIDKYNYNEVWGTAAKIVDDYEGRQLIVDNLSRNKIEFMGVNESMVEAYVVASYDALKPLLSGGNIMNQKKNLDDNNNDNNQDMIHNNNPNSIIENAKNKVNEIQKRREKELSKSNPVRFYDEYESIDVDDENRIITDVVLNRDHSDWGIYTVTGQQMSSKEIAGVLLLSDVYGAFTNDTIALAEKIAFECQPIVVMVPDLFDNKPWKPIIPNDNTNDIKHNNDEVVRNEYDETYEEWRQSVIGGPENNVRIHTLIRSAVQCLYQIYGVSSIVLFGTCYGGGIALEIGSGIPVYDGDNNMLVNPPPFIPQVIISWYPTRYQSIDKLYGPNRITISNKLQQNHSTSIMCVFAENDIIPGATVDDANILESLLDNDNRIKDYMIKIFPNQKHGFAHLGLYNKHQQMNSNDYNDNDNNEEYDDYGNSMYDLDNSSNGSYDDAEVACLLSTSFLETYSRIFLPTIGTPIKVELLEKADNNNEETDIIKRKNNMIDASKREIVVTNSPRSRRNDIRNEIENNIKEFVPIPLQNGTMVDPTDPAQEAAMLQLLKSMQQSQDQDILSNMNPDYIIEEDDDIPTMYAKLIASSPNKDFQLF